MKFVKGLPACLVLAVLLALPGCATQPAAEPPAAEPPPPPPPQAQVREIDLPADALFAFGKAGINDISDDGRQALDTLSSRLGNAQRVEWVRVVGHTDRIGDAGYNERLSLQRAEAVRDYLAGRGVPENLIEAVGRGSSEPLVECPRGTPNIVSCLAPNRRVHITVRALE